MKHTAIPTLFRSTALMWIALAAPALAQTADTTSAWRYFPLEAGNVWEYTFVSGQPQFFERLSAGEAVERNGQTYFAVTKSLLDGSGDVLETFVWDLRFDTSTATVVQYVEGGDDTAFTCPLDAPFDSTITCFEACVSTTVEGAYDYPVSVGDDAVVATQKYFDTQGCEQQFVYAADIGPTYSGEHGQLGYATLTYARVGKAEYGEPLTIVPDTTDAARYFPLAIGNAWEYEPVFFTSPGSVSRWEIVSDTTIDGEDYFVITDDLLGCSPCIDRYVVRFDPDAAMVVERLSTGEVVPWWFADCPLDAAFGSGTTCGVVSGGYDRDVELAGGIPFEGVTYKAFDSGFALAGYVADIGYVGFVQQQYEPGGSRLLYARVDGVEYGTSAFPVTTESAPAAPSISLAVFPNPATDHATVRFSLDRPQQVNLVVYDVLGRRVHTLDLGPQPAGEAAHRLDLGGLAPGLYVVRLTGDAGAAANARVVRR